MLHRCMGNADEACRALDEVDQPLADHQRMVDQEHDRPDRFWGDWSIDQVLHREAEGEILAGADEAPTGAGPAPR